jgi:tetratricopeptide (TPR) repeat protein
VPYPADFWLNFDLANALRKTQPLEAAGYYRVALAVRPTSSAAYNNLGAVLCDQLKEYDKAIECFRAAIKLDPKYHSAHRGRSVALSKKAQQFQAMKNATGCLAVAAEHESVKLTAGWQLYDAACFRALCAAALLEDPKTPAAHAARLAREQADLAMTWLHKAVAAGNRNVLHMKKDADLDALREREDFKKLIAELEFKKK